ncbi:MAG: ATP phosphoribosyltransferase [Planctomycetes bacterium]|nr:ATP phosphoribosyltransferase [Planctomycetota bacterium]
MSPSKKKAKRKKTARRIILGLPIGSLQKSTLELMHAAGFNLRVDSRSYYPTTDDEEIAARLIRPQDMSRYVERAVIDAGIAGKDWVEENGSNVVRVADLAYSKQTMNPVRWVLAVPEKSPINSVQDLQGKRVATEVVNLTKRFLRKHKVKAEVEFSHGATEAKAPDLVDAIVEVTETGSSLRANRLRIVDTVIESVTQIIANKDSWADPWKRQKIENVSILLQSAILARQKVGLKLNVAAKDLQKVLSILPAMRNPTISSLANEGWHAVEVMVDETVVRKIIPELKRAGAEGIIEYPLNKVIP